MDAELKRKLFHNLGIIYLVIYGLLPRQVSIWFFGAVLFLVWAVDWLRLRRPELNAWFLSKFDGIHRDFEMMSYSGILWTLFGTWITMLIFDNKKLVLAALGFLVFGDTAAALVGKKWGKHPWPHNAGKTLEGSAGFVLVSAVWAMFFLRPHVAILASLVAAYVETRPIWGLHNDNIRIPLLSGIAISIINIAL